MEVDPQPTPTPIPPATPPAQPSDLRWRIVPGQNLSQELTRVGREQCALLVSFAQTDRVEPAEAIHRVRQASKRLRGMLFLLRRAIGEDEYRRWSRRLRDESRKLADARDSEVMLQVFDRFVGERHIDGNSVADLRAKLAEGSSFERREVLERGQLGIFARLASSLETWLVSAIPSDLRSVTVRFGAKRAFRRACRQLERVMRNPTDPALHELRKRSKVVRAHVGLLARSSGERWRSISRMLDRLNDVLGEDHDLSLLEGFLREEGLRATGEPPHVCLELLGYASFRRAALRAEAMTAAEAVFQGSDTQFAKRLVP